MDTSAWKTEDKTWMKTRRAGWKEVKTTIDNLTGVRGKDKKFIKSFYLTGQVDIEAMIDTYGSRAVDPEKPMNPMDAPVLLECWLTADQSEENWDSILEKYELWQVKDSRRRFLDSLLSYPETGSLFSGLDERLYRFLCPTRCRPEDYPDLNEKQYIDKSYAVWAQVVTNMEKFITSSNPNPNNFIQYRTEEWKDSLVSTWKLHGDEFLKVHKNTISIIKDVLDARTTRDPLAVKVAEQLFKLVSDPDLPEPLKAKQ